MSAEIPKPIQDFRDAVAAACASKPEPSERRTFGIARVFLAGADSVACNTTVSHEAGNET